MRSPRQTRLLLICLALCTVTARSRAGIDFTPRSTEREEDGFQKQLTYLVSAPGQRVLIQPPAGWNLTGSPAGLEAHPLNQEGGVALRPSPFGADLPGFDPKGLELYRRRALAEPPPGATNARVVEEQADPMHLNDWKTYQFIVAWELGGQFWQESIMFVTFNPREGMMGTAVGTRAGFATIRSGLFALLSSWCRESAK